jgi:signal transduction histidine kinase
MALFALLAGLALWGWDDLFTDIGMVHPGLHRILGGFEFLLLGPGMAVMAFSVSEYLRMAAQALANERERSRQQRLIALGRVAAGLAHEVRNPLHNIRLLVEESRQVEDPVERTGLLQRVDANVRRIDRAVELVYRLARPASSSGDAPACDLAATVTEAVTAETIACAGRSIIRLADTPTASVSCPAEDLRMALDNLLRNATAAATEVHISVQRQGASWEILVRNPGVLPAAIAALGQGDALASAKPGGLGLGLAISRQLIEEVSGELLIQQNGGEVQARIRLPAATA